MIAKDIFDKYFNLDSADTTAEPTTATDVQGGLLRQFIIWGGLIELEKELIKLKGTADVCPRCGRHEGEAVSIERLNELRKKYPDIPVYFDPNH